MKEQSFSFVTFHRVRFPEHVSAHQRQFAGPESAVHWLSGPDSRQAENGLRTWTSPVWCGLAFYASRVDAEQSFENPPPIPIFGEAVEAWHALLCPFGHRGQTDWFGSLESAAQFKPLADPGGPLVVMTSAGYNPLPPEELKKDLPRRIDFITNIERVLAYFATLPGNIVRSNFQLRAPGHDGLTFTLWRDDAAMNEAAYRPGVHRTQLDRYKTEHTADRSSFTRARLLRCKGTWDGAVIHSIASSTPA
jgi:hypothetical protein